MQTETKYFYIKEIKTTDKKFITSLKDLLNADIIVLDWMITKSFDENFKNLLKILEREQGDIVLIGSDMGGFYANALANKLQVPCALFNPVINPREVFNNIQITNQNITNEIINSYNPPKDVLLPRLVVVGIKDNILPPEKTIEYWKDKCRLKIVDEGHQITNLEQFQEDIKSLSTYLFYDIHEIR